MIIHSRILKVDNKEGSIVVRYFSDSLPENSLALSYDVDGDIINDANGYPEKCRTDYNISLFDNYNPSSNDIMTLVILNTPYQWFLLQEKIKQNLEFNVANVYPLIGKVEDYNYEEFVSSSSNTQINSDDERFFQRIIKDERFANTIISVIEKNAANIAKMIV